jgi:hypothetical protein
MGRIAKVGLLGLLSWSASIVAAPMGYQGSTMSMGDFSTNWREFSVNVATTPRDAFGADYTYLRSDDKQTTRELVEANYTRLVYRNNLPNAQANLWFVVGVGGIRGTGISGTEVSVTPGVQVDYETTRLYFSAMGRLYRASGVNNDYGAVRAGFSFYEAAYDELQPWFVIEARRMRGLSDETEITPLLRVISRTFFVEAGVNNMRQFRFNFMYVF